MPEKPSLNPQLLQAYRRRRAPTGFSARVLAHTDPVPRVGYMGWRSVATAAVIVAAVILYLLASPGHRPVGPDAPEIHLPSSPDYWAEISIPGDLSVPDLSEIGDVPLFPTRPGLETTQPERDRHSLRPAGRRHS